MTHVDLTFCIIQENGSHESPTVAMGEARKANRYASKYNFPNNTELVPVAIDTHTRWGEILKKWVTQVARKGSTSARNYAYNVHRFRTVIAVAHANALGDQISKYLREDNLA